MAIKQTKTEEKYKDAEWLEQQYIGDDRSQKDIARQCGVPQSTIRYWCDKYDIEKHAIAQYGKQTDGYMQWKCEVGTDSADTVLIHRLLATLLVDDVSELEGKEIHHKNGYRIDNRADNLEVVSSEIHKQRHRDNVTDEAIIRGIAAEKTVEIMDRSNPERRSNICDRTSIESDELDW